MIYALIGLLGIVLFFVVSAYLRHRQAREKLERKRAEERSIQAETAREENKRKNILRDKDADVDPLIRRLLLARLKMLKLIKKIDDWNLQPEDTSNLHQWILDYADVMDFCVFEAVQGNISAPGDQDPFILKDEIVQLLEDDFDAETCLDYADEKLGIQRICQLANGDKPSKKIKFGLQVECGNGQYEHVNDRFERLLRSLPGTDRGYIYILTNDSLPGMLKIGKTHRTPEERASELSKHSGVPTPFVVRYSTIVSNCGLVERTVHEHLADFRVAGNREFFSTGVDGAKAMINLVIEEIECEDAS